MKYSLYDHLLKDDKILSHVFLECVDNSFLQKIANLNKNLSESDILARKIDIDLKVNGHPVNPENFFKLLTDRYYEEVEKSATEMVKKQLQDNILDIVYKLESINNVVETLTDDLNWDTKLLK